MNEELPSAREAEEASIRAARVMNDTMTRHAAGLADHAELADAEQALSDATLAATDASRPPESEPS